LAGSRSVFSGPLRWAHYDGTVNTQSGSETYSDCENPSNYTTIPYPKASASLEDVYDARQSVSGFLEFKGGDETSTTFALSCSRTEGDTTYALNGTLEIRD
jgi:hypothetical protein